MKVMGLDLSTKTGLAVVESPCLQEVPVLYTEQITFPKLTGWERALAIVTRIMEAHEKYKPDFVIIEGYGFANTNSLATLVEIGSIVRFFLWQEGIPYLDVPPNSVKQFVTGEGQSKKEHMILNVFKRWGFEAKTNDIADAVGLGMFGLACGLRNQPLKFMKICDKVLKGQPEFAKMLEKSRV